MIELLEFFLVLGLALSVFTQENFNIEFISAKTGKKICVGVCVTAPKK